MSLLTPAQLDQIQAWGERNGRTDHFGEPRWFRNEKALLAHIAAQEAEIEALRCGQGRAPATAGPGDGAYHETHLIPDSAGGRE